MTGIAFDTNGFYSSGKITFSGSYETFIKMGDGVNPDLAFLHQVETKT